MTLNAYGNGQGAWAGVDLLALATHDGPASPAADDLRTLLLLVEPTTFDLGPGAVVPVQVTVTNQGIAVPVTVTASMPPGVLLVDAGAGTASDATVTFRFDLAVAATQTVRYWVKLPAAFGPVTLQASVSARTFAIAPSLTLTVLAPATLASLRSDADALARTDAPNAKALRQASSEPV